MILAPTAKTITDLQADTTAVGAGLTTHMSDTSTHGVAEIANVATVSAEIDSDIITHAGLGDAHHNESHTVASHSDTTSTGTELETLTDGSDADSLHAHAVNDAKVTNATHTGDVTGATVLTIGADKVNDTHIDWGTGANQVSAVDVPIADAGVIITATEIEGALQENRTAINLNTAKNTNVSTNLSEGTSTETTVDVNSSDGTNATLVAASALRAGLLTKAKFDEIVANNTKVTNAAHTGDVTGSTALTIAVDAVDIPMLSATGTADATTFLRGDNTWTIPAGSGDVSKVGTPVDNQIGVWTGDGTIEGTSGLTYNGTALDVSGDINIAATKHLVLPLHNDATTPTLGFGDGDSGFYESDDDTIKLSLVGADRVKIDVTGLTMISAGFTLASLLTATPSATVPNIIPIGTDVDTGMGRSGADALSLIAGGVEGLRITEAAGVITSAFTNNIIVTGTVDGRDIDTDGTKLDTIDTNADVTADNPPQTHAMSTHTDEGALATLSTVDTAQIDADAVTYDKMQDISATDKLLGRSTAGAGTVEEIACTTAGRAILDDADNTAQRTTLDVDQAGTDNSTDVTLAGTPDYITISGQIITRNDVNLTTDITGVLPDENGGTGQNTYAQGDIIYASAADTLAKLAKGTDNHVLTMNGNVPNWEAATAGSQTVNIYLPAESAYLPNTNSAGLVETAGATTYGGFSYLTFDDTTSEHAIWRVPMPDYDGGNIIVKGFTKVATGPGASKTLQFNILTIGLTNSEEFDSANTVDTTINLSFSLDIGSASSDIMVASATIDPANVASDDLLVIELSRDVASDDLSGDGELVGIMLEYTRT